MKKLAFVLAFAVACTAGAAPAADKPSSQARMFVVDMHYIVDPAKAVPHKETHKKWVEKYTADGTFLFAGPKDDKSGGVIIIDGSDKQQLTKILGEDSFVKEGIVGVKITEFTPLFTSRTAK